MRQLSHLVRLITRLNIGGPARQALLLTRELSPAYETTLVAGSPQPGEGEMLDAEVDVTRMPLVRPLSPVMDIRAFAAVRALLGSVRPELVHTHMAKAGAIGRLAALSIRPRPITVHTFHGHVLGGYFNPGLQRFFITVERALAKRTDALIAVSTEIKEQLLSLGIGEPERWHVIPLGFDLSGFLAVEGYDGGLRRELGIDQDTPLIGVLGRLAPIKDHPTLIRALSQIEGAHLAILGDGESRSELERTVTQLRIGDRVHFVGWKRDVAAAIADLDVVALSSRNEGSPVSLIEALACARPVVATNVGGVPSVVRDGETGYLVPPGDARALADRMRALLEDRERREWMGREGRKGVAERHRKSRLVADIGALYGELFSLKRQ